MAGKRRTGGTALRPPSNTVAQARTSSKKITPSGPASAKQPRKRRSALTDATNFMQFFNKTIEDVEEEVDRHDRPNFSFVVLRRSSLALDHYIEHLALRKLQQQRVQQQGRPGADSIEVTDAVLSPVAADIRSQIESKKMPDSLKEVVNDKKIWVSYLHMYAMTGQGFISVENAEHRNLRRLYPDADGDDRTAVDASAGLQTAPPPFNISAFDPTPSFDALSSPALAPRTVPPPFDPSVLDPALFSEAAPLGLQSDDRCVPPSPCASLSEFPWFMGEDDEPEAISVDGLDPDASAIAGVELNLEQQEDSDSVVEDDEDAVDDDDVPDLDADDLQFASAFEALPDATPLALMTVTKRMDSILRQFKILNVSVRPGLRDDVLNIIKYLGRRKGLYPTSGRKKVWISCDTVAAIRAGVWTALAHDASRSARSVQCLLSVHLMVMFLDEFGGRVSSWLDRHYRGPEEEGRYLRWGMVQLTFCGYSDSGNPEFKLNVNSSSSKAAARFGDANFHVNTMATRKDQPRSQDPVFCMVALGVSQQIFADDVVRLFTDQRYGRSLLSIRKPQFNISIKKQFVDCAVFLYGRTQLRQPEQDIPTHNVRIHASDVVAWGQHHQPMKTSHLNVALHVISRRLGLDTDVTSRTFRTTFAFKNVVGGSIPAWRLAAQMGHFSGNKNLSRRVYAPTHGPVDTRRTAVGVAAGTAFSDNVRKALETNGAVMHLPDPEDVDPALLQKASSLLETLRDRVDPDDNSQSRNDIPGSLSEEIVDTFRLINNGTRLPFKESLCGLLSLTSASQVRWTSLVEQGHPFDDDSIAGGSDAKLLQWLLRGGSHLCPSCHESFHLDKIVTVRQKTSPSVFLVYNECLKTKHKRYCCFSCSRTISLEDPDHAIDCYKQHYDAASGLSLAYDNICVATTASFQQWKRANFFICPVESCLDQHWNRRPDANEKSYLEGVGAIYKRSIRRALPELGNGSLKAEQKGGKLNDHLASHFFQTCVDHTTQPKSFKVSPRLPLTSDGESIVCPIRNCQCQWQDSPANRLAYLAHVVNIHRFPILYHNDGSFVEAIDDSDLHKLTNLLPYLPTNIKTMADVVLQHPNPQFGGFYVRQNYDTLREQAKHGYKQAQHSSKVSPGTRRQRKRQRAQEARAGWTEEKRAAVAAKQAESYLKRKANATEEQKLPRSRDDGKLRRGILLARRWSGRSHGSARRRKGGEPAPLVQTSRRRASRGSIGRRRGGRSRRRSKPHRPAAVGLRTSRPAKAMEQIATQQIVSLTRSRSRNEMQSQSRQNAIANDGMFWGHQDFIRRIWQ